MGMYEKFTPVITNNDFTGSEITFMQNLVGLSYQTGDILYYNGTNLTVLHPGSNGTYLTLSGGIPAWAAIGGSGTVTDVSVVTANGVSGSVATSTTTPAITLTLGAITPSSVVSTGVVRASANDGAALGASGTAWSDLFLALGAVINFDVGDVTITHSANTLTIAGGVVDFSSTPTRGGSAIYYVGGTDVAVTDGGTGVSSITAKTIWAANSANTLVELAPGALQSIRMNSGNTAWEVYTPISAAGLTWTEVTGTSQSAAVNSGYICNNASLVTVTIPTTAAVGDIVRVVGKGAGGWLIAQNASEVIHFGNVDTTTGVGGSLASTHRRDAIELVCVVANTEWNVVSVQGNITYV
jgi:hypothetical protein